MIKSVGNSFYLFDNKSKFGTLVKEEPLSLEICRLPRGIQIGRTIFSFELKKDNLREIKSESEHYIRSRLLSRIATEAK